MREFFGNLLREARVRQGITLRALGSSLRCAPSQLSEIETGLRAAPKDDGFISKLATALKIDPDRLRIAAKNDRERRDMRELKEMFVRDDELAACYCKAKSECDSDQLKKLLMEAFQKAAAHTTPKEED